MAKKKHSGGPSLSAAALGKTTAQPQNPRRALIVPIAAIAVLWLVQFWGILAGRGKLWEDIALYEFPVRAFARMALFSGEFPHWNPFTFGGMPFFATGTGMLYPANLFLSLLPIGNSALWYLLQVVIVLHALIAGVCMYAYLRAHRRTYAASLFGAVAFMLGGYMVTHIIHPSIFFIAAWLPLIVLLLEKGIGEVKLPYAVMGGMLLGFVMLVGHAQVMFYAVIALLLYAVFLACQSKERMVWRGAASALFFAVAAGLCLVQYLPIFEASGHTARIEYTMADASEGSLQFAQLITALLPKVFGAYTGTDGVPAFWLADNFKHGYYNYWESSFYFGVSTLLLSVFLFRKIKSDRKVQFAAALALLSFLIALGGNFFFYKMLFALGIPGFNSFRHTPRILFIWGFLFPVMAAAALDSLNDLKSSKTLKIASVSLCAAALLLGLIAAAGGLASVFPEMAAMRERADYASRQGGILLMNALFFGTVLILFFKNTVSEKTAKILVVACLSVDMLVFAAGQHITSGIGADKVFGRADGTVETIKNLRQNEIFRFNSRQYIVSPGAKLGRQTNLMLMDRNQGYVSGVEITEGYNQFRLKNATLPLDGARFNTMLDLMNVRYYVNPHAAGTGEVLRNETCLPRAKLFYKAKVIDTGVVVDVSDFSADSLVLDYMNGLSFDHRSEIVVTDPDLAKFTGGGEGGAGEAKITKYGLNRIELDVDTDREAILWMSEIWYPSWKASINGNKTKIYRADYSFRAVIVPAGKSKVVFKFESVLFNIGAVVSLLTLVLSSVYLVLAFVNKKQWTMNSESPNTISAKPFRH
ncbi:MAG: YfhO family protein [Chitinispirillales bacterium]|jgi:hypothetical protein|nr:YfhO family protein [Chitinispirillales bacterium]